MNEYSVIIIDDEQLGIDVLKNYIQRYSQFELLGTFTDPIEALSFLKQHQVDLIFTDIAMPHISGTDLVKLVKTNNKFILVTSYSEYAIESFDLDVVDYLLKPVPFERFAKSIERFESQMSIVSTNTLPQVRPSFFIKEGDEYVKIFVDDIDYIEGMRDYAKIICGKNYYMALKTLKSIEEILQAYNFIRVHRSFIVPLDKILQFTGRYILIDKHQIPVGSSYREPLMKYLNENRL